jgi:hypothetical protein
MCIKLRTVVCKYILEGFLCYQAHKELGEEIMTDRLEVYLKGKKLPMNKFVENVINDVMVAIIGNLRDVEIDKITKIEIE